MAKAFILHLRAQDTSSLEAKVDEIKAVIQGSFYPFDPGELFKKIDEGMSSIDVSKDYLVPAGSTLVSFLAGFWLGQKGPHRRIRLMIHDVKSNKYREVIFLPEGKHNGK